MRFEQTSFESLFTIPQKNGLNKPKRVRGEGSPMINMGEIFANRRIKNIDMDLVPLLEKELNCVLEDDDLLFARQSLVPSGAGKCSIFLGNSEKTVFESHLIRCRLDKGKADPAYYFYFFESPAGRDLISTIVEQGAGVAGIRSSDLAKLQVPFPPLSVQKPIAKLLGALDDRIDLLKHTNQTLEAIAQTIFKSWFVNFDPVHAKQQGVPCAGLQAETADLFPDSFVESELGLIPKGWEIAALDEIASFLNGLALQKFPPRDDNWLPVIKIAQLRKGDCEGADKAGDYIKSEYIINDGDILFSWSGTLEVDIWCGGKGALNQHLFKVTSSQYNKWFYYYWTKYHLNDFKNIAAGKATTMGHIQRSHLHDAKVVIPSREILNKADNLLQPIVDKQIANSVQAKHLSSLRDTLLPRLISGKLDVSAIETQLEEIA